MGVFRAVRLHTFTHDRPVEFEADEGEQSHRALEFDQQIYVTLFAQAVAGRRPEYREGSNEELLAQGVLLAFEQGEKRFAFHGGPTVQILTRFGDVVRDKDVFSGKWSGR
jgi:hypothetical protein